MLYALEEIASAVEGKLIVRHSQNLIQRVATDSRTISSANDTLFFAILTQRNDGHNYILDAYQKGVRNFVAEKDVQLEDANFIVVKSSVDALQKIAQHHRQKHALEVIGITGSNGKTIVKEWLNQMLATEYKIIRSPKSYNSQIGVPISVLNLDKTYNLAIFEAGISQKGEMQKLEPIIQPTLGILTNFGQSHLENFSSFEELIAEKMKLFETCNELILPGKYLPKISPYFQGKTVTWGDCLGYGLCIVETKIETNSTIVIGRWNKREIELTIPFIDKASLENALTCATTLLHLGFEEKVVNEKLQNLSSIPMRLNIVAGKNGCTIINDSYSLDTFSLEIALDFLKKHGTNTYQTVILSDVVASGKSDEETYQKINQMLFEHGIDQLIAIGKVIGKHADLFALPTKYFETVGDFLSDTATINSLEKTDLLIKGARKFSFEKIVAFLQAKSHSTVLEINLNAVANNLNYFKSLLRPDVKTMVMVKALSYGSGTHEIAQLLAFNRINYLGVAYTDEGINLRKAGISLPIMVMNPDWNQLVENHLEPEIFSLQKLEEFSQILHQLGHKDPYPIHLKIDTGMHRLGFVEEDIPEVKKQLAKNAQFKVVSVFTHLAAADDADEDEFTLTQLHLFQKIVAELEASLGYSFFKHALNTAGILRFPSYQMDMVRLGIGLYGISSADEFQSHLENVGTLKTYISQVKTIKKGESVGYNRAFIAKRDSKIAIIPIGYADGFSRGFSQGVGQVICQQQLVPVIGHVCMDMTMIDITDLEVKTGDEVIIFGENLPVKTLAQKLNTISYEVLSSISERVKRIFVED